MMDGYRLVVASDVSDRDGLGLELYDASGRLVAEIFRDDRSGSRSFTPHSGTTLPLPILEWFVAEGAKL